MYNQVTKSELYNFQQFHLRVVVHTFCTDAHLHSAEPKSTSYEDHEQKESTASKFTAQGNATFKLGVTHGLPTIGMSLGGGGATESSAAFEKRIFNSEIIQHDKHGKIWWDYIIKDQNESRNGKSLTSQNLPQVDFKLHLQSSPEIRVEVRSYWSVKPQKILLSKWKLLKGKGNLATPSNGPVGYSTVVQCLQVTIPHTINKRYIFDQTCHAGVLKWHTAKSGCWQQPEAACVVRCGEAELRPSVQFKGVLHKPIEECMSLYGLVQY